ncbi:ABC transporter ATP-binding protein [Desulfitobacterium sp. THU1]|uniref:ABC transporter ATP-binding protein n=1 Tax=Desulfitobacterium sp. THU1 TaxID=3138072 RepID=UPI00311FE8C2
MSLEIRNLSFGYNQRLTFENVSFTVEKGEVVCLLGANGAGKTTLFKTVLGLYQARQGQVIINGKDVSHSSRRELAKVMGYVPQNHIPPFPYSVMDVVLMGRTAHINNYAVPSDRDLELAQEVMRNVNISYLEDKNYTEISGGERQLVLIARALAQQPQILVMDEPASSLDYGNQIRLLSHVKRLAKQGLSIIMSTHSPEHALYCDAKVIMLKDGHILCSGAAEEVITEGNLHKIYGIDVEITNATVKNGEQKKICIPVVA